MSIRYGWTRMMVLVPIAALYLILCLAVRLALLGYEGTDALTDASSLLRILGIGSLYDLAALAWLMVPFVLNAALWPNRRWGRTGHAATALVLVIITLVGLGIGTIGEFLFWNEFSTRFNFIAVNYLIYTREVTGNIIESYPVGWLLLGMAAILVPILAAIGPLTWTLGRRPAPRRRQRLLVLAAYGLLLSTIFYGLDEAPHDWTQSPAEQELSGNGLYALFRAFRNNDLNYAQFYMTLPEDTVTAVLRDELQEAGLQPNGPEPANGFQNIVRPTTGPLNMNVVLVTIESLGADYVESFGGTPGLTPHLDALTRDSLTFSNLYATGLRTVRGLEAVTLSIPPTPGRAVPIRSHNQGLMSLGSVLARNGYDTYYLYGGYSYFDNMQNFFSGAGYTVLDRTDIPDDTIDHETIWGVADEDLFDFALTTLDKQAATGRPFLAQIMTTSNHRPYTYPDGRIDIPSHSGRPGAVKYTDWAIGRFLDQVRQKPWFDNTLFVFLADHTSHGRGEVNLPIENYRIPMWIYAPSLLNRGQIDYIASQIDVAPTILGLLKIPYQSEFFGQDILTSGAQHQRAFMANYLTVGYLEEGIMVELAPQQNVRATRVSDGEVLPPADPQGAHAIEEAISYYQNAAEEIQRKTSP